MNDGDKIGGRKIRIIDVREGDFFEVEVSEIITQLYETVKRLVEERDKVLTAVASKLPSVEDAVAIMAVVHEGSELTADSALIKGLLDQAVALSVRIRQLNTAADRFSSMRSLNSAMIVRLSLKQAQFYGF